MTRRGLETGLGSTGSWHHCLIIESVYEGGGGGREGGILRTWRPISQHSPEGVAERG